MVLGLGLSFETWSTTQRHIKPLNLTWSLSDLQLLSSWLDQNSWSFLIDFSRARYVKVLLNYAPIHQLTWSPIMSTGVETLTRPRVIIKAARGCSRASPQCEYVKSVEECSFIHPQATMGLALGCSSSETRCQFIATKCAFKGQSEQVDSHFYPSQLEGQVLVNPIHFHLSMSS